MAPRKPRNTPGATPASPQVRARQKQLNSARVGGAAGASEAAPPMKWGNVDLPIIASRIGIDITKPYEVKDVYDALRARNVSPEQMAAFVKDGNAALQWLDANPKAGVQIVSNVDPSTPQTKTDASRKTPADSGNAVEDAQEDYAAAGDDGEMDGEGVEAEAEQARRMTADEARAFLQAAGVHGSPKNLSFRGGGVSFNMRYRRPDTPQPQAAAAEPAPKGRKPRQKEDAPAVAPDWRKKQDDAVIQQYEQQGVNAPFYATWGNKVRRNAPSIAAAAGIAGGLGALGAGYGVARSMMSPQAGPQQQFDPDAERERQLIQEEDEELGLARPQNPAGMQGFDPQILNRLDQSRR